MAFDQVSLFLYPPGWEQQSEATTALHSSGRPVRIVSAARSASGVGRPVRVAELSGWLVPRRFAVVAEGPTGARFASTARPSALGRRAEIELIAGAACREVNCLYCRFLLTRDAPLRLEWWEALVRGLCEAFGLRIVAADGGAVGHDEFLAVLRRADNWRLFAGRFGWGDSKP
jgi:hypothetical protein